MTRNRSLILNLFLLSKRALSWVYYIFRGQFYISIIYLYLYLYLYFIYLLYIQRPIFNLFLLPKRALSWVYYIFRGQFSSCSRQIKMKLRTTLTLLSSFFTVGTSNIQRMRLFRKGETPNHLQNVIIWKSFIYDVGRPSIVRAAPVPKQDFQHHSENGLTAASLKANTRSNPPLVKWDSPKTFSFEIFRSPLSHRVRFWAKVVM